MIQANFIKNNLQAGGNNATSAVEGIKQRIVDQLRPGNRKPKTDQSPIEQIAINDPEDEVDEPKRSASSHSIAEHSVDKLMPGQLIKNVVIKFNSLVVRETNFLLDVFNFNDFEVLQNLISWQDPLSTPRKAPVDSKTQKTMLYISVL